MKTKNISKEAGVLLVAAFMIFSAIAVTADTSKQLTTSFKPNTIVN